MPFPQLNADDFQRITAVLNDLHSKSEAISVMLVERAGYLIAQSAGTADFDATTVATLAGNAFAATQFMVDLLQEPRFSSMYQQGEHRSVLWLKVDDESLLVAIFPPKQSVGMVKFFSVHAAKQIADQLVAASQRAPEKLFDIATENPTDVGDMFRRMDTQGEEKPPEQPEPPKPPEDDQQNPPPLV